MMETGLLDEHQVPAINFLHARGIISPRTRLVPSQYETFLEFGESDFVFYGFKLRLPRHSWPFLAQGGPDCGWLPADFASRAPVQKIHSVDFAKHVPPKIETFVSATITVTGPVNAVRLSANARLSENLWLGATNALNGDKVLPIDNRLVRAGENIQARISYEMGGGLSSFKLTWID